MKTILNLFFLSIFTFNISIAEVENRNSVFKTNDVEISSILNKAEVYPNPAEDYIYLKINDSNLSSDVKIEVMSIIGNKMKITHDKLDSGLYKIDLSNIPVGHYYVLLTIDSQKSLKKFIKQ